MLSGISATLASNVKTKTDAAKLPPKIRAKNSRTQPKGMFMILNSVCIYAPSIRADYNGNGIFLF